MGNTEIGVDGYRIEPLSPQTWDAFADLAERHNGVWGGMLVRLVPSLPGPNRVQEA